MAGNLSNARLLAASVADNLSAIISRRGYAVATHGAASSVRLSMGRLGVEATGEGAVTRDNSDSSSAWAPDPVTGYYRPARCAAEIDAAQLRAMLLNHKK